MEAEVGVEPHFWVPHSKGSTHQGRPLIMMEHFQVPYPKRSAHQETSSIIMEMAQTERGQNQLGNRWGRMLGQRGSCGGRGAGAEAWHRRGF